jgi:hypothetical protein
MFEAKVTAAARSFPSVIVCMYDADAPFGSSVLHKALKTHPLMASGNVLRVNSSCVQPKNVPLVNSTANIGWQLVRHPRHGTTPAINLRGTREGDTRANLRNSNGQSSSP